MATYSVKVDTNSFDKKTRAALKKKSYPIAYKKVDALFRRAYNTMLRDYDKHDITVEIKAGPAALNFSRTLGGYGNLFSFIGFDAEDDPTGDLRILLEQGTRFRPTVYRNDVWYFQISTPSKKAIRQATDMPWEQGSSWAEGVESGISGLSHYMYKKKKSRSGMGIQIPDEYIEDLTFTKRDYLSEIFAEFRETISRGV